MKKPGRGSRVTVTATLVALGLSLATLCLTLMGYGYEMGYLNEFGLTPEALQRTPTDFLLRAYLPLVGAFEGVMGIWTREAFLRALLQVGDFFMHAWVMVPLCVAVPIYVYWRANRDATLMPLLRKLACSRPMWRIGTVVRRWTPGRPRLLGWFGWTGAPALLLGAATLLYVGTGAVVWATTFVLVVIPASASTQGREAAIRNVKQARGCDTRVKLEHAPCVRVLQGDVELARGRLITRSAERVLLFPLDAASDERRYIDVSLSRARLEVITQLAR